MCWVESRPKVRSDNGANVRLYNLLNALLAGQEASTGGGMATLWIRERVRAWRTLEGVTEVGGRGLEG